MKTSLKTLLFALILGIATAYAADGEIRISDPHLTTLAEIDFSTATSIIIDNCPALENLDGLIAPMATKIYISKCPNLTSLDGLYAPFTTNALFLQAIVRQNLARIAKQQNARWSGHRAAWCGAVARCARARLMAARAKAAAEAELAAAEAEAAGTADGEEAGPAGAGSGAGAHKGRRGLKKRSCTENMKKLRTIH